MIKTSAIIATKNRPAELAEMLRSLVNQTRLPDEVVIIDQSEDDDTQRLVESMAASHRNCPQFVYCYEPTATGASAARNSGIDQSHGDIVMFFDDDVILERDYV